MAATLLALLPGLAAAFHGSAATGAALEARQGVCSYASIYPRQYIVHKTDQLSSTTLDGDLSKPAWQEVDWTEDFVDISTQTPPKFRTRAKMRWDDHFLYVGAELDEPKIWATLTQHDSVIFQDNDFEVFIDANATNHFYKEFEMNAFNTTWMLQLAKPYSDGGSENSTRVLGEKGWTMEPPLRSAVKIFPAAALNNPQVQGQKWSVEIALPLAKLVEHTGAALPSPGSFWRLGFSRVEYEATVNSSTGQYQRKKSCQSCPEPGAANEDNWVWTTQGEINMHAPERWGILQFAGANVGGVGLSHYGEWPSRCAAMAIYYAQKAFANTHNGSFAHQLEDLLPFSSEMFPICEEAETTISAAFASVGNEQSSSWEASVTAPGEAYRATIRSDRYLTVARIR